MFTKKITTLLLAAGLVSSTMASAQSPAELTSATSLSNAATPKPLSILDQALMASEGVKLERFPSDGIERYLPIGTGANGIPETVQGVWWVTVNPLGFLLATLGGSTTEWDPDTRTVVQHLSAPGSLSFHNNDSGTGMFMAFLKAHAQFVYRFSADYKFATLNQAFEVLGQRVEVPTSIVRYQMRWVEDGHFVRETWFFGKRAPDYHLRRIVKADGTHDKAYDAYLLNADAQSYIVVQD